jgi:hypothetical protein
MGLLDRFFGKLPAAIATNFRAQGGSISGRTFAVSDVTTATDPLPIIPFHQAASKFLGGQVESCSQYHGQLVAGFDFIRSSKLFTGHLPLIVPSPFLRTSSG